MLLIQRPFTIFEMNTNGFFFLALSVPPFFGHGFYMSICSSSLSNEVTHFKNIQPKVFNLGIITWDYICPKYVGQLFNNLLNYDYFTMKLLVSMDVQMKSI
jgi:hypothetical protein